MAIDTLFQPAAGGGGGSSSGDYVKDHFQDTSRLGTNNTTLTSSASTNPMGFYFNDTDSPYYGVKTLFIKEAKLIEDRTKWVNSKPTYELIFTEYVPYVRAYVSGNVRIRNGAKGKVLELRSIDDVMGVTGVINQLAWLLHPSDQATATADLYLDSVAGSTLQYNSASLDSSLQGVTKYNAYLHAGTVASSDIHDYKIEANQTGLLAIEGIVCYFSGSSIIQRPGSTYNDKTIVTSTTGTTLAPATITGRLGGKTVIYKNATAPYNQATTEPENLSSIGQGAINTNLITVTTGHGASFGRGYGVACSSGTSMYYGVVQSISTDTLTVGPTLAFGLSGTIYKLFAAGPTYSISPSTYKVSKVLDFYELNNAYQSGVFGATLQGELYFNDPSFQYTAWGKDLQFQTLDGYVGLGFKGNTSAFLQIDGRYAAVDFEYMASGILNGTFSINGAPGWNINAGQTGMFRKTIFTDGAPGWNSFVFAPGQSHIGVVITKVNLYDVTYPVGLTAGLLAEYASFPTSIDRGGVENASISQLGNMQRVYADQLFLQGAWTRGVSSTFAGNVAYFGASANSVMNFQYFGKNLALVGTEGGSMTLTIDGSSVSSAFNALKSVASMTWHSVALTYKAGATCVLSALSFERPNQMELKSLQQKEPRKDLELIPQNFIQANTPLNAKDGDVWVQQKSTQSSALPNVWFKLFGVWNRAQFNAVSDDPNVNTFVTFTGDTADTAANAKTDGEQFNGNAWASIPNAPNAVWSSSSSNAGWNFGVYSIDGYDTISGIKLQFSRFSGNAWAVLTTRATGKGFGSAASFAGLLTSSKGATTSGASNGTNSYEAWNGSAWAVLTTYAAVACLNAGFVVNNLLSTFLGQDTAGSDLTTHVQKDASAANSSATAVPAAGESREGASLYLSNLGIVVCDVPGSGTGNNSYTWNGSAWSSAIVAPYSQGAARGNGAGNVSGNLSVSAGGWNTGGSVNFATAATFNGLAFAVVVSRSLSRGRGAGGTLGI